MKTRRTTRLTWLLLSAAPFGCNAILGNDEVPIKEYDKPTDGSTNDGNVDGRVPDTSVGEDGRGGSTSADGSFEDNRTSTDTSTTPDGAGGSVPRPDGPLPEGGSGTPDSDGGSTPQPDGIAPMPDGTTPGIEGGLDSTIPPGDGGPTCTAPNLECAGKCVSATDPKTCGSCTHDCTNLPQVSGPTTCQAGMCVVPPTSCAPGYAHCSTNTDEGCEVDISKPANCGSCTTVCSAPTPLCAQNAADGGANSYQCKSTCVAPSPDLCGMSCTNKATDPLNCGACMNPCPPPTSHGQASCAASMCTFACNVNYSICNGDCVNFANDALNCQTCGHVCPPPTANGTAVCTNSACAFACNSAFPDTCAGTCVNFKTDVNHCGTCPTACPPPAQFGTAICSNGICDVMCSGGQECNNDNQCHDLQTDAANCGSCGHSCLGGMCAGGTCLAAPYVPNLTSLNSLTMSDGVLYWTDMVGSSTSVASCSTSSCSAPTRLAYLWGTGPIAVAGGRIYQVDTNLASILTCTTASGCIAASRATYYADDPSIGDQWNIIVTGSMLAWNYGRAAFGGVGKVCAQGASCSSPSAGLGANISRGILAATPGGGLAGAVNPFTGSVQHGGKVDFCSNASSCGSPTTIVDHVLDDFIMGPLTVTPGNVAFFSQSADLTPAFYDIYSCSVSSCSPTSVYTGSTAVTAMASDATSVYWAAGSSLLRCSSTNCTSVGGVATASSTIVAIALDATQVFFADSGTIYRLAR